MLVLDDDPHVRELLRVVLENAGFIVAAAPDVRSALAQCEIEMPKLMIVDLMLPNEDGEAFLNLFRRRWRNSNVPVILLSASARREAIAQRFDACASVAKPFFTEDIRDLVIAHTLGGGAGEPGAALAR